MNMYLCVVPICRPGVCFAACSNDFRVRAENAVNPDHGPPIILLT
jgi:hypothetical protein